jgi:hypothetical protein
MPLVRIEIIRGQSSDYRRTEVAYEANSNNLLQSGGKMACTTSGSKARRRTHQLGGGYGGKLVVRKW